MHFQQTPPMLAAKSWSADSSGAKTTGSSVGSLQLSEFARTPSTVSAPLSDEMVGAIVHLAKTVGRKLVKEAQTPATRKRIASTRDIHVFQCVRHHQTVSPAYRAKVEQPPSAPQPVPPKKRSLGSISRSLWHRLTRRRKRAESRARGLSNPRRPVPPKPTEQQLPMPSLSSVPRIVGLTRVHVSLDELLDIIGHRSAHAAALLHPSMRLTGHRRTLVDTVDEHVCVRSTTLRTSSRAAAEARDFLVAEHHHAFKTPTGRRGYAVACNSVHWDKCPSPSNGMVRASLYESGLVAIESETDPETVKLFCVAEMNLKGRATEADNQEESRHRVIGTLARITQTIEERTKMLLSLDHTHVFHKARRANANVDTCSACHDRIAKQPPGIEPYACRKCYAKVCGDCSSIWQRGQKRMRLCMECWADAELNRTYDRPLSVS